MKAVLRAYLTGKLAPPRPVIGVDVRVEHVRDGHALRSGEARIGVDVALLRVHDRATAHTAAAEYVCGTPGIEVEEGSKDHGRAPMTVAVLPGSRSSRP